MSLAVRPSGDRSGDAAHSVLRHLAQLDQTESAVVLASGMAAMACTMVSLLRPGDHLLASGWLRTETRRFFEQELPALGVQVSFVDPGETRGWRRALTRTTRALYLESPVDPTTRVVPMHPPRTLARELGLALVVDATVAGPINFRPTQHGADIVLHATQRYLDGHGYAPGSEHGYAFGGVVCGSDALVDEIRGKMRAWGAEPHPAVLDQLARGLNTLPARVGQQNATALAVSQWAATQVTSGGAIEAVHYLGLDTHPDHLVATASFSGYGNLMLLTMRDGEPAARTLLDRLRRFGTCEAEQASRIGGTTSVASALPGGSVRLNIGLDDATSLIHDLTQALD